MNRDQRLKSLAGFGKFAKGFINEVWVVTSDNLTKCTLKSVNDNGLCTVILPSGKTKQYRKTRAYVSKTMAQLRFVRDTDKFFSPKTSKFRGFNIERIRVIRNEIADDEPAWFI